MSPAGLRSPGNQPASPSTLAGAGGTPPDSTAAAGATPGGEPEQGGGGGEGTSPLRETVQKLRTMEMDLVELSARFPAAAPALRQAVSNVRAALRQVIASPGQPEPRAPSIGG